MHRGSSSIHLLDFFSFIGHNFAVQIFLFTNNLLNFRDGGIHIKVIFIHFIVSNLVHVSWNRMFPFLLEHELVDAAPVGGRGVGLARPRAWACGHGKHCGA